MFGSCQRQSGKRRGSHTGVQQATDKERRWTTVPSADCLWTPSPISRLQEVDFTGCELNRYWIRTASCIVTVSCKLWLNQPSLSIFERNSMAAQASHRNIRTLGSVVDFIKQWYINPVNSIDICNLWTKCYYFSKKFWYIIFFYIKWKNFQGWELKSLKKFGLQRLDRPSRHPALRSQHGPSAHTQQTSRSIEPLWSFGKPQEVKPIDVAVAQAAQVVSTVEVLKLPEATSGMAEETSTEACDWAAATQPARSFFYFYGVIPNHQPSAG